MRNPHAVLAVATLAGVIAAAGCTLFTGPKSQLIALSVTSDTIVASERPAGTSTLLQFTIPVSIHNPIVSAADGSTICLASILQASGGEVWEPMCAEGAGTLTATIPSTIAPGATSTFQWTVTATTSGLSFPMWESQTVDGTYRLRLGLGAEAVLVSNQFAISVLTTSAAAAESARQ